MELAERWCNERGLSNIVSIQLKELLCDRAICEIEESEEEDECWTKSSGNRTAACFVRNNKRN